MTRSAIRLALLAVAPLLAGCIPARIVETEGRQVTFAWDGRETNIARVHTLAIKWCHRWKAPPALVADQVDGDRHMTRFVCRPRGSPAAQAGILTGRPLRKPAKRNLKGRVVRWCLGTIQEHRSALMSTRTAGPFTRGTASLLGPCWPEALPLRPGQGRRRSTRSRARSSTTMPAAGWPTCRWRRAGAAVGAPTLLMRPSLTIELDGDPLANTYSGLRPIDVDGDGRFEFVQYNGFRFMQVWNAVGAEAMAGRESGRAHP